MDGQRFDAFTKALAVRRSRRGILGVLGGAAAGLLGTSALAATKRPGNAVCRKDGDCASGVCLPKDATGRRRCHGGIGNACHADRECKSGHCVDGVCCDGACVGQCESCAVAGNAGTCTTISGAPAAGRPACAGTGVCAGTCDGTSSSCVYPGTETICGAASCEGTTYAAPATCDGSGACRPGATVDCDPYVCGDGACLESCTSGQECTSSLCIDGACCAGADVCEDFCCSPDRAETETCCPGTGECCECFNRRDPGNERIECCPADMLCRSLTNSPAADTCCHNDEVCVNGSCCWVGKACEGGCCATPCCNGACCAAGEECAFAPGESTQSCQPVRPCTSDDECNTAAGETCTDDPAVCCPPERLTSVDVDIDGVPTTLWICCPYGQAESVFGAPECCPLPDRCGTSRGSFGRL